MIHVASDAEYENKIQNKTGALEGCTAATRYLVFCRR